MMRGLQKCKPNQRRLLAAFLAGYSSREIAMENGTSLGAIHAGLSRARRELRKYVDVPHCQVPPDQGVLRMKSQPGNDKRLSRASVA